MDEFSQEKNKTEAINEIHLNLPVSYHLKSKIKPLFSLECCRRKWGVCTRQQGTHTGRKHTSHPANQHRESQGCSWMRLVPFVDTWSWSSTHPSWLLHYRGHPCAPTSSSLPPRDSPVCCASASSVQKHLNVQNEIYHLGFHILPVKQSFPRASFSLPLWTWKIKYSHWIWTEINSFHLLTSSFKKEQKLFGQLIVVNSIFLCICTTSFVTGSWFVIEELPATPTTHTKHSHRKHHQGKKRVPCKKARNYLQPPPGLPMQLQQQTAWPHVHITFLTQSRCLMHCMGWMLST